MFRTILRTPVSASVLVVVIVFNVNSQAIGNEPRLKPAPRIKDVEHRVIAGGKGLYCAHPRKTVFGYFGKSEIVAGHRHAPAVTTRHGLEGYVKHSVILLQRSTDGGRTWPVENNVTVYDHTKPDAEKKEFFFQPGASREKYNMFNPDSVFYFGYERHPIEAERTICFALRSPDRGRTWESVPTIITHPNGPKCNVLRDCQPVVRMPDGKTLLAAMSLLDTGAGIALYSSTDHGLSWSFQQRVAVSPEGKGRFTYAGLILHPSGELQLYCLHIGSTEQGEGCENKICLTTSEDGGKTWTQMRPIQSQAGRKAWGWKPSLGKGLGPHRIYRSPWPIVLNDDRILVTFARRYRKPIGIGGIISDDGGKTWSEEFVIRQDATLGTGDIGYQMGCQLEDGTIAITYYWRNLEGRRFICSSRFRLE